VARKHIALIDLVSVVTYTMLFLHSNEYPRRYPRFMQLMRDGRYSNAAAGSTRATPDKDDDDDDDVAAARHAIASNLLRHGRLRCA
jgi:hypothetical protein